MNLVVQQIEIIAEKGWYSRKKGDGSIILCNIKEMPQFLSGILQFRVFIINQT